MEEEGMCPKKSTTQLVAEAKRVLSEHKKNGSQMKKKKKKRWKTSGGVGESLCEAKCYCF